MRPSSVMPDEGDILEGTITRIEPYGAFCGLRDHGRLQGLIHISQLAEQKVEKVEDMVSVDDPVWVKVLQVEMDPNTQRWRIKLSLKDVSQDGSRVDLGREREDRDQQRNQLETNLNSMIGMGVAIDPMAGRLTMKLDAATAGQTVFRGGYSLVGDEEGEWELPSVAEPTLTKQLPPIGRGRGATLPAWMTNQSNGPTGMPVTKGSDSDESVQGNKQKRNKKHSKSHRKHHKKRSSKSDKKRKRYHGSGDSDGESSGYDSSSSIGDRRRRKRDKHRRDDDDQNGPGSADSRKRSRRR